jgi:hypothetical protein
MPFKSEAQRRFLWANEPALARRWTDEYGSTPRGKVAKALIDRKYGRRR